MSVKGTKTGISEDRFFYCEEYWDGDNICPKDSLIALAIIGARYAINIVHAKELVGSVLSNCNDLTLNVHLAVKYVQSAYLCEFSEQEVSWPLLFGGWWPTYQDGLDASILWRTGDCIADFAYWCCRTSIKRDYSLSTHATMAFSRKYNMSLISKPKDPDVFISLKPFFGTKKCLKDYYSLVSRNARDMKRKYHKLFIMRNKKFNNFVKGKEECPSVLMGYIRRHPRTVIIPGMDGVRYTKDGFLRRKPTVGVKIDSTMAALRGLVNQGIISCDIPGFISRSEFKLHLCGITAELEYDLLPIAAGGAPVSIMSNFIPGVKRLYEEHNLFIVGIDDSDTTMTLTKHWEYLPFPLVLLQRCQTTIDKYVSVPAMSLDTSSWWFKAVMGDQISEEDAYDWGSYHEEIPTAEPLTDSSFEEMLRTLLDSVNLSAFRARIIPLNPKDKVGGSENNTGSTTVIDGKLYLQTLEGSWIPAATEDNTTSFWDQDPSDEEEVATFFWD